MTKISLTGRISLPADEKTFFPEIYVTRNGRDNSWADLILVYYSKTIDVDRCGIFVFENPPNDNYTG